MDSKNRFNVEEHTTLENKIIDVFPVSHRYIHDLEQQIKKQKEVIDKVKELLEIKRTKYLNEDDYYLSGFDLDELADLVEGRVK